MPALRNITQGRTLKYDYSSVVGTEYDPGRVHLTSHESPPQPLQPIEGKGPSRPTYNYKPTALRTWFLLLVAAFLLACIGVTEYAIRTEPSAAQLDKNATLARRGDSAANSQPTKGWVGGPWGNNLAPNGVPRGMPRLSYDRPELVERIPSASAFMPSGVVVSTVRSAAPTAAPVPVPAPVTSRVPTQVHTSKTITTDRVVTLTVPRPAPTTSEEKTQPPMITPTPVKQATADQDTQQTHTAEDSQTRTAALQTTIYTTTLAANSAQSLTVTIPEMVSTSAEVTTDSEGHQTALFHTTTLQSARTTTKVYEVTPVSGYELITTIITSVLEESDSSHTSPRTTRLVETTVLPAVTTKLPVTTTDASGHKIIVLAETTLPASTLTTSVLSTIPADSPDQFTNLGLETQRRIIGSFSSSSSDPTAVRIVLSTMHYTTVIPTTIPTFIPSPSNPGLPNNASDAADAQIEILGLTAAAYFSGAFLPTILAVAASFCLEAIAATAKLMQPFHAMASSPKPAAMSVFLRFDEWMGLRTLPNAIRTRQPLILLTQLAVMGGALLAPLSAEAVRIYTAKTCTAGCFGKIAVELPVARVLEALLAVTAALLIGTAVLTGWKGWKTGVNHNPWSAAGMASLCLHPEMRTLLGRIPRGLEKPVTSGEVSKTLAGREYVLGHFWDPTRHAPGESGYGLIAVEKEEKPGVDAQLLRGAEDDGAVPIGGAKSNTVSQNTAQLLSFGTSGAASWLVPLGWRFRALLVVIIAGVLGVVVSYQKTTNDTGFELFMDSRGFGVRFLFTAMGVVLGGLMEALFRCKYCTVHSVTFAATPPTNPFYTTQVSQS